MGIPKRKNNIKIYKETELTERRQELLDEITKSDVYLPDSILHDDLDRGMLDYIKNTFKVVSDGKQIPIIDKILTIQRWAEFTETWTFSDEDGNIKLPFIATIRKPDVQPGTNPSVQRTVPDRHQFFYTSVATWNGSQMGADIYKIPQPVPVDISYDVTIICTKFRDLNRFNKIVLQHFSSRQSYTIVKGHYIPIVMDSIEDNTPMETVDGRRFYIQNYKFTMLGFLIDSEEFEVTPAISRVLLMNEFVTGNAFEKKSINKETLDITVTTFKADGNQTTFSVGEGINILFNVAINGLVQTRDLHYYHVSSTSKITFVTPPTQGSVISVIYYKGKTNVFYDVYGKIIQFRTEYFEYNGSTLTFTLLSAPSSIISLDINGLIDIENTGYLINGNQITITFLSAPFIPSNIGITYVY